MPNPQACRFETATLDSLPLNTFTAPVVQGEADYDFRMILQTIAETGSRHYISLSRWDDQHSSDGHQGTTCITLAYKNEVAADVRALLEDVDLLHYEFPIIDNRGTATMFAFPSEDHFNHRDTTRAASLIAAAIGVKGVVKNSFLSTFFFRFPNKDGVEVVQRGSQQINENLIERSSGEFVEMKRFLAK